jgi:hypothetical protein
MNIKNQLCTFEQAVKLQELGIVAPAYFVQGKTQTEPQEAWMVDGTEDEFYNMYSCAELGVMLGSRVMNVRVFPGGFSGFVSDPKNPICKNVAEARAQLLIFYLDNHILFDRNCNAILEKK